VVVAIGREKQLKRWRREKKIGLIAKINAAGWTLPKTGDNEMRSGDSLSVELSESAS